MSFANIYLLPVHNHTALTFSFMLEQYGRLFYLNVPSGGILNAATIVFDWLYSSSASLLYSLPTPLFLYPPNGAPDWKLKYELIQTLPASTLFATVIAFSKSV